MSPVRSRWCWVLALLLVAALYAAWTPVDGAGQLGRDGPRYLMMADHYSLYRRPDPIYSALASLSHLPPLYPMVLAWTGSADHLHRAHLVTSLFLLSALAAFTAWLTRRGATLPQSTLLMLVFAVLPGTWLTGLLIQSEYLYLSLSLLALLLMDVYRRGGKVETLYGAAVAIGAACLARTIGICLIPALILAARKAPPRTMLAAMTAAVLPTLAWQFLHHADLGYGAQLQSLYGTDGGQVLLRQLAAEPPALRQGFEANLLNLGPGRALADVLGLLCLGSAMLRGIRLEPDGAYLLAYLGILLVWPFPEEAQRFIWAALPVFLVQPVLLFRGPRGRSGSGTPLRDGVVAALAGMLLALCLPALYEGAGRYWSAPYSGVSNAAGTVSWYDSAPGPSHNRTVAENALVGSMQLIAQEVPASDCVISTRPDLVGYYAHRISRFPPRDSTPDPEFADQARRSGCGYAFGMSFKDSFFPATLHPVPRLQADGAATVIYTTAVRDETTGDSDILTVLARLPPAAASAGASR